MKTIERADEDHTTGGRHDQASARSMVFKQCLEAVKGVCIEILQWLSSELKADICQAVTIAEPEFNRARYLWHAENTASTPYGYVAYPSSHRFPFGIPDLAWINIFGPMYVRHFGRERLLSAPAPIVREIDKERVLIQLCKDYHQIESDWPRFNATRERVIDHLGRESFQKIRGPGDPPKMYDNDPNGVPATSIPRELVEWRHRLEAEYRRRSAPAPNAEVTSLDDILSDPSRFEVRVPSPDVGGPVSIIDLKNRVMMSIDDVQMALDWTDAALKAGVPVFVGDRRLERGEG